MPTCPSEVQFEIQPEIYSLMSGRSILVCSAPSAVTLGAAPFENPISISPSLGTELVKFADLSWTLVGETAEPSRDAPLRVK